jgi:hypothetical protein
LILIGFITWYAKVNDAKLYENCFLSDLFYAKIFDVLVHLYRRSCRQNLIRKNTANFIGKNNVTVVNTLMF